MKGQIIGYRRVSSTSQNLDRQELPDVTGRIFEEKLTGAKRDRPALQEMLGYVRDGDEVHVHSIDRLARNLKDLEDIVSEIIGQGASIRFIKEALHFRPDQETDPFQKLMFQMLGSFAEFERSIIRARQAEGIKKAKEDGKFEGRKPTINQEMVYALSWAGVSGDTIADMMEIGRASVFRIIKKYKADDPYWMPFEFRIILLVAMLTHIRNGCGIDEAYEWIKDEYESDLLKPIKPFPYEWSKAVCTTHPSEKQLNILLNVLEEQLNIFEEIYFTKGPVEYTQSKLDWMVDKNKSHEEIAERTGLPVEAIGALVKESVKRLAGDAIK